MGKLRGDRVNGVLLLDKPVGMTSNRALQSARRLLNAAKAGHTGTLDPLASGLLPLTFGEATKFSADLLEADKAYRATLALGVTTSTGDADGEVIDQRPVAVTAAQVEQVLTELTGPLEQIPPMYSALKHHGRPLYALARAGVEVPRAPRSVRINRLALVGLAGSTLTIDVDCSKGTYVRVLAEEIGKRLGCGAHLQSLRRTRVATLTVDQAIALDALERLAVDQRRALLWPADRLLHSLPAVSLDATAAERFRLGQRLALDARPRDARVRVYESGGELLGTATIDDAGVLHPARLVSKEMSAA